MAGILSAFNRGKKKQDPMRESAALTTVYLLEQNQKFEQFMRRKVDELETRVAAQQARLSTREETEERELWAALESFEDTDILATEAEAPVEPEFELNDDPYEGHEASAKQETESPDTATVEDEPEAIPNYLAMMSGATTPELELSAVGEVPTIEEDLPLTDPVIEIANAASTTEVDNLVPEDVPNFIDDHKTAPDITAANPAAGDQSLLDDLTMSPEEEIEADVSQYETFHVNLPEADVVEDILSEFDAAEEVELLTRQPTANTGIQTSSQSEEPLSATGLEPETAEQSENSEPSLKISEEGSELPDETEADAVWQANLANGEKDDWT